LNKDEHSHLINEWKEDYTFQGVKNALKKIQSIIDLYNNEYSHVVNAFSEMVKDNEKLLKENKILKDEVLRVSKTTWN
jgi:predicted nuclease with TOPRIM domain